jgi:hypothetical protein
VAEPAAPMTRFADANTNLTCQRLQGASVWLKLHARGRPLSAMCRTLPRVNSDGNTVRETRSKVNKPSFVPEKQSLSYEGWPPTTEFSRSPC